MTVTDKRKLLFSTIDEVAALYRAKAVSPVEVTEAVLERLALLEPKLNAFVTVLADQAIVQAKAAEAVFLKGEATTGKLLGIPVSLKDIFATKGIRTTIGSRIMSDNIPDEDAYVYGALIRAGAVVFGKTHMLEFAYGSIHPDYGQCNNPWDVNRTAGGSSTGSGSSIAAGIGYASLGTDTGGSIRAPASFCGIVGLKPTYDLVPRQGTFPLSDSLDHVGPLTRTVKDNAIVLESISTATFDYDAVFSGDVRGMKVGVLRSLTDSIADTEIRELSLAAVDTLLMLGATIIESTILSIEEVEEIAIPLLLAEASTHHRQWFPHREKDYAPSTFANIKEGFNITAVQYLTALERRRKFTEVVNGSLADVDVLVCPSFPFTATMKDPSFEEGSFDVSLRTIPFNVTGHPALVVSAGNTLSDNLPVGFQIVGKHGDEASVYRIAHALQVALGGFREPPL
ncbi:amidase [Cohnella lupini]|uniref:Aspartyl-tRNA(Asn)/glutamyl-tRNA(Gln) amidotransferase subunit A n=1 Tax=Cohnella lupini TaxID=1294267 RepID=A0A3D9IQ66_9BACL|nr:amidase [Cohnella lupini]RED63933.1 aspartyl-tRNA(Asn)/glutamyl-tRNA(Gln) amidotransferase subunit A [Cohnella lupini]